jgi:co-chaperonin GroES (HSP10)
LRPVFREVLVEPLTVQQATEAGWLYWGGTNAQEVHEGECVAVFQGVPLLRGWVQPYYHAVAVGVGQHKDTPKRVFYKAVKAVLDALKEYTVVTWVSVEHPETIFFVERLGFARQCDILEEGLIQYYRQALV